MKSQAQQRQQGVETATALTAAWLVADQETITTIMREVLADRAATEMLALSAVWLTAAVLRLAAQEVGISDPEANRADALYRLQRAAPLIALTAAASSDG